MSFKGWLVLLLVLDVFPILALYLFVSFDLAALDGVGSQVLRQEKARDSQGENGKSLLHKCLILRCG